MDTIVNKRKVFFALFVIIIFFINSSVMIADYSEINLLSIDGPLIISDQLQENDTTEFTVYNRLYLAQGFTPQKTPLTMVDVKFNKPKKMTSNIRLSIRKDLDGPDLVYHLINTEDIPFYIHWINFDIADIDIIVNESYYIVLEAHTPVTNSIRWRSIYDEDINYYPNGMLYRYFSQGEIWEPVETDSDYVDACFRTYSYQNEVDLVCDGFLNWTNITPAQGDITGMFTVENQGTPFSRLNWKILNWPGWGTWEYSIVNETGLMPEDGKTTVQITIEAPHSNVPDIYQGKIVIVNEDDENDTEEIFAQMVTSKQKKETDVSQSLMSSSQRFHYNFFIFQNDFFNFFKCIMDNYLY